jgi:uncharacterized phage protein (TIGR02218 family)
MRKLSPSLQHHLAGEVTTLACCFLLTLRNNMQYGFTDYECDLVIDNVTYSAKSGFNRSAVMSNSDFSTDNLELDSLLDHAQITEHDLLAGKYDMAEILVFMVNYQDLSMGRLILKSGVLGEIKLKQGKFMVEVMGLAHKLSANISETYSNSCRANFADDYCQIKPVAIAGKISQIINNKSWLDESLNQEVGYFNHGLVKFTSGANAGYEFEVKDFVANMINLCLHLPYKSNIGDKYEIFTGCDKKFSTCIAKFNNAINFRGEPHLEKIVW